MSGVSAATVAAYAALAGAAVSAYSSYEEGQAANKAAKFEAEQMERNASDARAVSQREAIEQRRRAELAQSRALAVAAASGAGALDGSVLDLMGDIGAEGDLNARTALYSGEARGAGMDASAAARRYEGKQAQRAGQMKVFSTLLSDDSSDLGSGLRGGIKYLSNW